MKPPPIAIDVAIALERFELRVDCALEARVTGFFGPSGCGKSTLIEAIAGVGRGARRRVRGRLSVRGEKWLESESGTFLAPQARRVGYVAQQPLLFPHLDVRGNLTAGARRAGDAFSATFEEVVAILELEPLLQRRPGELSGGERQRVALGRALCSAPVLLVLDEPLSALDEALRRRILPYLVKIRDRFELPMLVVSHNPVEMQALCDEVLILDRGRIIDSGTPDCVLAPRTAFVNVFPVRHLGDGDHTSTVALGAEGKGPTLSVPRCRATGMPLLIGIAASEILLATVPPRGLSARNALPATIEALRDKQGLWLAVCSVAGCGRPWVVEITAQAMEALSLRPGQPVTLITKTTGIEVFTP